MNRKLRIKPAVLIASAAAATVLVGTMGGTTLALWHDQKSFTSEVKTGKVAFAVGVPGAALAQSATAGGQKLDFTFGPSEAAALLGNMKVAIPIQVDSLAQGNKGLRYTVTPPAFGANSIFSAATTGLVRVENAAECTVAPLPQQPSPLPAGYYTRTPVASAYSDADVPTSQFWCLTSTLDKLPGSGTYTNVATVTADSSIGSVSSTDQWWANVTSTADAAQEPIHHVEFAFTTFRPGE